MSVKKDGLTIPACSRVEEVTRKNSFCLLQDCGGKRLVCAEKISWGLRRVTLGISHSFKSLKLAQNAEADFSHLPIVYQYHGSHSLIFKSDVIAMWAEQQPWQLGWFWIVVAYSQTFFPWWYSLRNKQTNKQKLILILPWPETSYTFFWTSVFLPEKKNHI